MKKEYKILITGLICIALLDAVGSIATLKYTFDYSYLSIVSLLIYAGTGFATARVEDLKMASFFGAILGLFDSTIGWKMTMLINPKINIDHQPTVQIWIITVFCLILFAAFCAFIGGLFTKIIK